MLDAGDTHRATRRRQVWPPKETAGGFLRVERALVLPPYGCCPVLVLPYGAATVRRMMDQCLP